MLKQEMSCVIKYHQNHLQKLHHLLEESNTATEYGAGVKCLLLYKILEVERNLLKCSNKFSSFITNDSCAVEHEKLISHKIKLSEDKYDNLATNSEALVAVQSNIPYFNEDMYDNENGTNNNEYGIADDDYYYDPEDEDYDHEDVGDHNDDAYDHENEHCDCDDDDCDQDDDDDYDDCDHNDDNDHYFCSNHNSMNFSPSYISRLTIVSREAKKKQQ